MVDLLEHEGVKVQVQPFPKQSQVSGCFLFSTSLGPCVLINRDDPVTRRRFTAAHEYCHVLVDRSERSNAMCLTDNRAEFIEMRANALAAAFLLPSSGVAGFLNDLEVAEGDVAAEHVIRMTYHFGVSYEAVLWRLRNLGWLDDRQRQDLAQVKPARLARLIGLRDRQPGHTESEPDRLRAVAIEAWRSGELSIDRLADLLEVVPAELNDLLVQVERTQPRPARSPAAEPEWL